MLVPTLVRVRTLVPLDADVLMIPPRVISPAVATPDRALTRFEPTEVLLVSEIVPDQLAAVLLELMMAPCELTAPTPVMVPDPPKPAPAIVKGSAPIVRPFRSSTAPLATVVPLVVSLKAVALPRRRTPRFTSMVVNVLLEPEMVS